jgi:hypothetical protein
MFGWDMDWGGLQVAPLKQQVVLSVIPYWGLFLCIPITTQQAQKRLSIHIVFVFMVFMIVRPVFDFIVFLLHEITVLLPVVRRTVGGVKR